MNKKRCICLLIVFLCLFSHAVTFGIEILSNTNSINPDKDGVAKITVKNPHNTDVFVRVFPNEECSNYIKVYPKIFNLQSKESQVVRFLVKDKKPTNCRINFMFEDVKDIENKDNIIKTRFIISLKVN